MLAAIVTRACSPREKGRKWEREREGENATPAWMSLYKHICGCEAWPGLAWRMMKHVGRMVCYYYCLTCVLRCVYVLSFTQLISADESRGVRRWEYYVEETGGRGTEDRNCSIGGRVEQEQVQHILNGAICWSWANLGAHTRCFPLTLAHSHTLSVTTRLLFFPYIIQHSDVSAWHTLPAMFVFKLNFQYVLLRSSILMGDEQVWWMEGAT